MRLAAARTLLLLFAATASAPAAYAQAAPKNDALRRELLSMLEADQVARAPLSEGRQLSEAEMSRMRDLDAAHTRRLLEIFKGHGFPSVALVGKDGAGAAITMLLHSSSLELQLKALPHVRRAARRGELRWDDFALLTDDVLANQGKPQLYGTNFGFVEGRLVLAKQKDPARLDARRAKLGLPPVRVYAKLLAEMYKMPLDESSLPPETRRK